MLRTYQHPCRIHVAYTIFFRVMLFIIQSQVSPSSSILSCFLPIFYFRFFKSSMTSSYHRCLDLPTGLVPIGFQSNSFLVDLAWSILCIWSSHLILCALMNLTISALSINLHVMLLKPEMYRPRINL